MTVTMTLAVAPQEDHKSNQQEDNRQALSSARRCGDALAGADDDLSQVGRGIYD